MKTVKDVLETLSEKLQQYQKDRGENIAGKPNGKGFLHQFTNAIYRLGIDEKLTRKKIQIAQDLLKKVKDIHYDVTSKPCQNIILASADRLHEELDHSLKRSCRAIIGQKKDEKGELDEIIEEALNARIYRG